MLPPLPALPSTWRRDLALVVAIALGARLAVLAVFEWRGLSFPYVDAAGYVAHAAWLRDHANLSIPVEAGARFFHGVPLLLALLGRFGGDLATLGVLLNLAFVAAACALFYRNFPSVELGVRHAVLLPAWLAMSSTLHSEGAVWCFALAGLVALRLADDDRRRAPLLLIAGFALVCRPTAFLILLPAVVVACIRPGRADWPRALRDALLLGFFPALMAAWSRLETGVVFIQSAPQAAEFTRYAREWGDAGFSPSIFAWPGESLLRSLVSDRVSPSIKLLNLAHLAALIGGLFLSLRAWLRDRQNTLALWLLLGLAINGLFVSIHGGVFGGTIFYRFLATQANAFLILAWSLHARLPGRAWWLAGAISLALATQISRQA
jgi:hypothetical protein